MISVGENKDVISGQMSFDERAEQIKKQEGREAKIEGEKKMSPYKNWAQLNRAHGWKLALLAKEEPYAMSVLMLLIQMMDNYNAVVISFKALEELTDFKRTTLSQRCIKPLKEKGFIHVYKSGVSNVYSVNPDLIWSSWGKNKDYAQFPANVVLASSEQEDAIKKKVRGSRKNLVDPRQGELFD